MRNIEGNIVDVINREIYAGEIIIENQKIQKIIRKETTSEIYILPGLIDSHVHIESSMLIPSEFSKLAIQNGTVGIVTDPHEIANVCGIEGIEFMINDSKQGPLKTYYAVPSCVPMTKMDKSGAILDAEKIDKIFTKHKLKVLGEMMDYPGVINKEETIIEKLEIAKKHNAIIDGHAPGLNSKEIKLYAEAGISTDHECSTIEEAIEKINLGIKILIREGSAAQNFEALYPLISKYNEMVMLCTDDSHPDELIEKGHINKIIKKGLEKNLDIFDLLTVTCINPIKHYGLEIGLLRENDPADFIVVDDLQNFNIIETTIDGKMVYSNKRILFKTKIPKQINNFKAEKIKIEDIKIKPKKEKIKVIEVIDKELITNYFTSTYKIQENNINSNINKDILKIITVNRYENKKPAIGFINGFGLKTGAIASSISHDSHNIIAIGTDDENITKAINEIIEKKGGLCYVKGNDYYTLELEIGGLMTTQKGEDVAKIYKELNQIVKVNGCNLTAPFMILSFMSLIVIPKFKMGDMGLFDVEKFQYVDLFI
ncbi:MAG: adenine deaminase [Bacteroidales bacterium]|jgi:adenine deaminase|nr:adenine deaminase [Bacteroidales bacterium]